MPHRRRARKRKPAAPGVAPLGMVRPPIFGAPFFLGPLGALARQECQTEGKTLPQVRLHLADGEVLDVCHLVGVAPVFVVLAVHDDAGETPRPRMRTEILPYDQILRVTIRASSIEEARIGFDALRTPTLLDPSGRRSQSPEAMLEELAAPPVVKKPALEPKNRAKR